MQFRVNGNYMGTTVATAKLAAQQRISRIVVSASVMWRFSGFPDKSREWWWLIKA